MEMRARWILRLVGFTLLILLLAGTGSALEPPTAKEIARYRENGTLQARIADAKALDNHRLHPQLAVRLAERIQEMTGVENPDLPGLRAALKTLPPGRHRMPTTGEVNILALLLAFPDYPPTTDAVTVDDRLFGDGDTDFPYESLRAYYQRSSYDQLDITGNVLGWYTTPYPRNQVVENTAGRENLIKEALLSYDAAGHDFTQYDNDDDGAINYLVVIWTGPHGNWAEFWWGYMTTFQDNSFSLDGKKLSSYSWQWENRNYPAPFSPRTVIHETGHALGLPDYYDYDNSVGPPGGVGRLDIMHGYGDHGCFSKFMLDWLTPTFINSELENVVLRPSGREPEALLVMPEARQEQPFGEFFMVQNRAPLENDSGYPTNGLVIWHVDSSLDEFGVTFRYNNSYSEHKLLRLMEADGLEQIEQGQNADAGDYYRPGSEFGPETFPSSSRYDSTSTGIQITDIEFVLGGNNTRFNVRNSFNDDTPPVGQPAAPDAGGPVVNSLPVVISWGQGTAADPESGIIGYELEVLSVTAKTGLYSGYVGNVTEMSFFNIPNGETFAARVRAMNGVGLLGEWSSYSPPATLDMLELCEAIGDCGWTWWNVGDALWFSQFDHSSVPGTPAAQSGHIPDGGVSSLVIMISGPGTMEFRWKVSSEEDFDFLSFSLGAELVSRISGEQDWEVFRVFIPGEVQFLNWTSPRMPESIKGRMPDGWTRCVFWTAPVTWICRVHGQSWTLWPWDTFWPEMLNPRGTFSPLPKRRPIWTNQGQWRHRILSF